jgi:hypothetical protein
MVAENFESFGQAILNKLIAEIAANPYPKQAQLRQRRIAAGEAQPADGIAHGYSNHEFRARGQP